MRLQEGAGGRLARVGVSSMYARVHVCACGCGGRASSGVVEGHDGGTSASKERCTAVASAHSATRVATPRGDSASALDR